MRLGIGQHTQRRRARCGRFRGRRQRRPQGRLDGWLLKDIDRRLPLPGQRHLFRGRGLRPFALGTTQRLKLARLGAGTALVHVQMTLALLALAAARAVAVQQPVHAKLPVALAVVVQGLAAELQRFGQARLVDPVLHQLDGQ